MAKKPTRKKVETLTHEEATRRNIPTAEYQSLVEDDPKTVRYPRNTDLDPQLVWRGKDQQDWSDLSSFPRLHCISRRKYTRRH